MKCEEYNRSFYKSFIQGRRCCQEVSKVVGKRFLTPLTLDEGHKSNKTNIGWFTKVPKLDRCTKKQYIHTSLFSKTHGKMAVHGKIHVGIYFIDAAKCASQCVILIFRIICKQYLIVQSQTHWENSGLRTLRHGYSQRSLCSHEKEKYRMTKLIWWWSDTYSCFLTCCRSQTTQSLWWTRPSVKQPKSKPRPLRVPWTLVRSAVFFLFCSIIARIEPSRAVSQTSRLKPLDLNG